MNKYQRPAVAAALMNVLVMLLFPPFASKPLAKGILPSFDGFYPLFSQLGNKPLFTELLTLQLMFVGINTLIAWLVLQKWNGPNAPADFQFARGIAWFAVVNLVVIGAFPPFESYQSLLTTETGGFDSFYFVFGSRSRRTIFWPLLYLEGMFIVINALGLYLLFSSIQRRDGCHLHELAQPIEASPEQNGSEDIAKIIDESRRQIGARPTLAADTLGRGGDRRHTARPDVNDERRSGIDRREEKSGRTEGGY